MKNFLCIFLSLFFLSTHTFASIVLLEDNRYSENACCRTTPPNAFSDWLGTSISPQQFSGDFSSGWGAAQALSFTFQVTSHSKLTLDGTFGAAFSPLEGDKSSGGSDIFFYDNTRQKYIFNNHYVSENMDGSWYYTDVHTSYFLDAGNYTINFLAGGVRAGGGSVNINGSFVSAPIPSAAWLLGSCLAGLIGLRRKSKTPKAW